MSRPTLILAALALLTAASAPTPAQEFGGVHPRQALAHRPALGHAAPLPSTSASAGCRLSATSVTVGVNRAFAPGAQAGQRLVTATSLGPGGCRPLVSTQITAGVNLGLGAGSAAGQVIESSAPRGALATVTYARGVNLAAGAAAAARQRILSQTSP